MKKQMITLLAGLAMCFHLNGQQLTEKEQKLLDVPDKNQQSQRRDSISYEQALQSWKSVESINAWIGKNFHYDISRAIALGSKRDNGPKPAILTPAEMFTGKSGICVDLSRFAFETIKKIKPEIEAHYLMIDFEPIVIQGSTIRKHWVVAYRQNEQLFVMADSKRPGTISGPYEKIEDFIAEYEQYRERKIVAFKLLNDYKKKQKKRLAKIKKSNKGDNQKVKG